MNEKQTTKEAHRLIDLATKLLPEDEGMDLTDMEYEVEDMARLRDKLSSMRHAIDGVNKALAEAWYELDPNMMKKVEVDGLGYYLGTNTAWVWMDEGSSLGFAKWLKKQQATLIEAIVPERTVRRTMMPDEVKDTFFRKRTTSESLTIKNRRPT